ncbi:MAG: site-specific integrase [Candidatus Thiodiazotropha endolucinida]
MADIRKRVGKKGTTYQVRYPSNTVKSGYAFKTFDTLKAAREFRESYRAQQRQSPLQNEIKTVSEGIKTWLEICKKEGRDGRDPVTPYTLKTYEYRASLMTAYPWEKPLPELQTPDIVAFRSWLLRNYSRDQARKALSSFHSMMKEMANRGYITSNVASGVSIRADSRYDEPVVVPTTGEVRALLEAADRLANSKNRQIERTWERYRPMLYLAADTGMRPQEYVVVAGENLEDQAVTVDRALERGGHRISVTKTPAGRRTVDLSPDTFDMVTHYRDNVAVTNKHDLVFPTASGHWQSTDNWRKRGFYAACLEAGLVEKIEVDGKITEKPKFKPYDLRHFYASMLIEQRVNLKRIQKLMGHEDVKTTLNVYGHLIEKAETAGEERIGMLQRISPAESCGNSVANPL